MIFWTAARPKMLTRHVPQGFFNDKMNGGRLIVSKITSFLNYYFKWKFSSCALHFLLYYFHDVNLSFPIGNIRLFRNIYLLNLLICSLFYGCKMFLFKINLRLENFINSLFGIYFFSTQRALF